MFRMINLPTIPTDSDSFYMANIRRLAANTTFTGHDTFVEVILLILWSYFIPFSEWDIILENEVPQVLLFHPLSFQIH